MRKNIAIMIVILCYMLCTGCNRSNRITETLVDGANTSNSEALTSGNSMTAVLMSTEASPLGGNAPDAPSLILNGQKLDVYTSHYIITEEYAIIPIEAFLKSIGAEYADSPANEYGTQCFSFLGKRFISVPDLHLFLLEEDYWKLLEELDAQGATLSRETVADRGLLPKTECMDPTEENGTVLYWADMWVDHISLMNALRKCGINISIESDDSTQTITVMLVEDGETVSCSE